MFDWYQSYAATHNLPACRRGVTNKLSENGVGASVRNTPNGECRTSGSTAQIETLPFRRDRPDYSEKPAGRGLAKHWCRSDSLNYATPCVSAPRARARGLVAVSGAKLH